MNGRNPGSAFRKNHNGGNQFHRLELTISWRFTESSRPPTQRVVTISAEQKLVISTLAGGKINGTSGGSISATTIATIIIFSERDKRLLFFDIIGAPKVQLFCQHLILCHRTVVNQLIAKCHTPARRSSPAPFRCASQPRVHVDAGPQAVYQQCRAAHSMAM